MATLGFERGTASMALQIELQMTVEKMIHDHADTAAGNSGNARRSELAARLTILWSQVAALRSMTYDVICAGPADPGARFESSMVRLRYAELLQDVQRLGYELCGAEGLKMPAGDHGFAHGYLYGLHDTIAGGTSEIQRNIIAERLLALPREA
jgi:alkylation response protein AidB-like acyl-CoA dehydrogenase